MRRGDKQIQIRKGLPQSLKGYDSNGYSLFSCGNYRMKWEQGKAETCASLSAILPQIKDSDTKQIVNDTLKKLNTLWPPPPKDGS